MSSRESLRIGFCGELELDSMVVIQNRYPALYQTGVPESPQKLAYNDSLIHIHKCC